MNVSAGNSFFVKWPSAIKTYEFWISRFHPVGIEFTVMRIVPDVCFAYMAYVPYIAVKMIICEPRAIRSTALFIGWGKIADF